VDAGDLAGVVDTGRSRRRPGHLDIPSCQTGSTVTRCRFARPVAFVLLAALLLAAACGAGPTSPADCRPTAPARQGSLLVLRADPPDSTITAVVPSPAPAQAGRPYDLRWLVDARKASSQLRVQTVREGTGEVYRATIASSGTSGQLAEFQAPLVFPHSGCWDADVFTGTALGSLTFKVV
jgi:hypothetical protein